MITAVFRKKDGVFCGFTVKGHSGYARHGSDIVCAAASSMVNLTVRLLEEGREEYSFCAEPEVPQTVLDLNNVTPFAGRVLSALYCELRELEAEYGGNLRIITQEIQ